MAPDLQNHDRAYRESVEAQQVRELSIDNQRSEKNIYLRRTVDHMSNMLSPIFSNPHP